MISFTGAIGYGGSRYGPGSGPVHLDDVSCSGSENTLTSCSFRHYGDVGSNCRKHLEDLSVLCSGICSMLREN